MAIPPLGSDGLLPLGRHTCTLDEVEAAFVSAQSFATSSTRANVFADLLAAIALLQEEFDTGLIERMWIGGTFASAKEDPSDVDVTFLLSGAVHTSLSGSKRDRLAKLLRVGGFASLDLSVDGFMLVRQRVANPWLKDGVSEDAAPYMARRGAWDDWWSRHRVHGAKGAPPLEQDADPVRGYLEVVI